MRNAMAMGFMRLARKGFLAIPKKTPASHGPFRNLHPSVQETAAGTVRQAGMDGDPTWRFQVHRIGEILPLQGR
jgi:hypothetical protein